MTNHNEMHTVKGDKQQKRGEMIAVCSAKGGIGRTILTVNLAVALFKKNISVSILDADFQFGDVGMAMDLQSTFTIKEVLEGITTLDRHSLAGYLCLHDSGVRVLPAGDRPEYADLITKDAVEKILQFMLSEHDFVVADTGVGLNEHTLHIIERADQVLLITSLEMAAMKNTKLMLETLEILGLRDKVRVVINRSTMDSVMKAVDAASILGETDPIYIPNDPVTCGASLNIGIPFVMNQAKTEVAKAIFKMAELITSRRNIQTFQAPPSKTNSLLARWLPRKRQKGGGKG